MLKDEDKYALEIIREHLGTLERLMTLVVRKQEEKLLTTNYSDHAAVLEARTMPEGARLFKKDVISKISSMLVSK